jgi:hypothetical protein
MSPHRRVATIAMCFLTVLVTFSGSDRLLGQANTPTASTPGVGSNPKAGENGPQLQAAPPAAEPSRSPPQKPVAPVKSTENPVAKPKLPRDQFVQGPRFLPGSFAPHASIVAETDGTRTFDRDFSDLRLIDCADGHKLEADVKEDRAHGHIAEICKAKSGANDSVVELAVQTDLNDVQRHELSRDVRYSVLTSYVWSSQFELPKRPAFWAATVLVTRTKTDGVDYQPGRCTIYIGPDRIELESREEIPSRELICLPPGIQPLRVICESSFLNPAAKSVSFIDSAISEVMVVDIAVHDGKGRCHEVRTRDKP